MNNTIKNYILIIIIFFMLILTSSCNVLPEFAESKNDFDLHDNSIKTYKYFQNENKLLMEKILVCFENSDKESLKNLFLEEYKTKYNLEFQIEKAFTLFKDKGKSIKYENMSADEIGKHTVDGKNVMLEGSCVVDVIFDNGENLELYFLVVNINEENSSGTGLRYIYLSDSVTGEIYRIIGEYEEFRKDKAE